MNYNATPVNSLPPMPPQQNDPNLMSQIMQDAYMDNQRPNAQVPHIQPSFQPPAPVSFGMESPESNSFIPDFDVNVMVEKLKEPIMVAVLVFLLHTDAVQGLLKQHIPSIFEGDDALKQILVKAVIAGVGFLILKQVVKQ